MTKENWIKWLQVRIPILKDKANEFWLAQALDGFHKDEQSRQAAVSGSLPLLEDAAELKRIKDGLHKIFEDEEPGRGLPINIYCLLYPNECGNDR